MSFFAGLKALLGLAPPFDSFADLSNCGRPASMTRAVVWQNGVRSAWKWSPAYPTQVWHISATGGGSWQLQPLNGEIVAGTLPTPQFDAAACAALGATLTLVQPTPISVPINVPGVISIKTRGSGCLTSTTNTGAAVIMNVYPYAPPVKVEFTYNLTSPAGVDTSGTSALLLDGDCGNGEDATNDVLWQKNRFDVTHTGCYAGIVNNLAPITTTYGLESPLYYSRLRVHCTPQAGGVIGRAQWGVQHMRGSGTGNVYEDMQGELNGIDGQGPAWIRFEAPEPQIVAGDVLVIGGHLGGPNAALWSFGRGDYLAAYGYMFTATGCQFDALMTRTAHFDAPALSLGAVKLWSNNNGGGDFRVGDGWPPFTQKVIQGRECDLWHEGNVFTDYTTGAVTREVFELEFADWDGAMFELIVAGLVAGVAGGAVAQSWVLGCAGGTPSAVQYVGPVSNPTPAPAGFFHVTVTPVGKAGGVNGYLKFSVSYAGAGGPTAVTAQFRGSGGAYTVRRISALPGY